MINAAVNNLPFHLPVITHLARPARPATGRTEPHVAGRRLNRLRWFVSPGRKLLREHQLEAVTKAAQQEELQRRRRLEQQRQEESAQLLPEYGAGEEWE